MGLGCRRRIVPRIGGRASCMGARGSSLVGHFASFELVAVETDEELCLQATTFSCRAGEASFVCVDD